jgi:flagellar hook assembly protein FlgD
VEDDSYTPRSKPAEAVLTDWYGRDSQTGLADVPTQRAEDHILATFPVPFRERSVIRCKPGALRIYDSSGRLVRTIETNESICYWDGTDLRGEQVTSGVYIYRMGGRTAKTIYISE